MKNLMSYAIELICPICNHKEKVLSYPFNICSKCGHTLFDNNDNKKDKENEY